MLKFTESFCYLLNDVRNTSQADRRNEEIYLNKKKFDLENTKNSRINLYNLKSVIGFKIIT